MMIWISDSKAYDYPGLCREVRRKVKKNGPVQIVPVLNYIGLDGPRTVSAEAVGLAHSWNEAKRLLHDAGYCLVRAGGDVSLCDSEEARGQFARLLVTVRLT
jgi:hypothetical protein